MCWEAGKVVQKAASTLANGFNHQVALQELRVTIGSFAATFDGKFAPGFDYKGFEGTLRDRFLLEFEHEMEIVLTKRKGVDHGIADGV